MNSSDPRVDILVANYRESRQQSIALVHSFFHDIPLFLVAFSLTAGSGFVAAPRFLLALPLVLGGFGLYLAAKLRAVALVSAYLVYLEHEVNKLQDAPLLVWMTLFGAPNLSPATAGSHLFVAVGVVVTVVLHAGVSWLAYSSNSEWLNSHYVMLAAWMLCGGLLPLVAIVHVLTTIRTSRRLNVDAVSASVEALGFGRAAPAAATSQVGEP